MKCPVCGGNLQYEEEVMGSFVYPIAEDGSYDETNKEYCGDSWNHVVCSECGQEYDYKIDSDWKIILGEPLFRNQKRV